MENRNNLQVGKDAEKIGRIPDVPINFFNINYG